MHITHSRVRAESLLGMKRRRIIVEVIMRPGADGGHPSDGRRNECLLTEV